MKKDICAQLGMEIPIFAFTHSPDVVIEVSKAGGMGVLGAAGMLPEELDVALQKITKKTEGKPFGIDLILPNNYVGKDSGGLNADELEKFIPQEHRDFVENLLEENEIGEVDETAGKRLTAIAGQSVSLKGAQDLVDVAFKYPMKLLVNALGVFPDEFREKAHAKGIKVGALVGQVKHALRQKEAGVDIIIAQGYEAGGHTGDIANTVLVPQVVDAVGESIPVLMAGGVADGRQIAAAMALGAQGVWTGSVWLMTEEAETHPIVKEKFKAAVSSDTIRSRSSTGKHARQLISGWTDAWENPENPEPLQMPLHGLLVSEPRLRIEEAASKGNDNAKELINYFVGQNVGMLNEELPASKVLENLHESYEATLNKFTKVK